MEFEVGETFDISASVNEDDTCCESGDLFIRVHTPDETLRGRAYVNVVVIASSSPDVVSHVPSNPLDVFHTVPACLLPFSSLECRNMSSIDYHDMLERNVVACIEFLDIFIGYFPSFDSYILYLDNMPEEN